MRELDKVARRVVDAEGRVVALVDRQAWLDGNPLRKWRQREGVSIMAAASRIRCSTSTIQKWEAGAATPIYSSFVDIAAALGVKPSTIQDAWRRWARQNPAAR